MSFAQLQNVNRIVSYRFRIAVAYFRSTAVNFIAYSWPFLDVCLRLSCTDCLVSSELRRGGRGLGTEGGLETVWLEKMSRMLPWLENKIHFIGIDGKYTKSCHNCIKNMVDFNGNDCSDCQDCSECTKPRTFHLLVGALRLLVVALSVSSSSHSSPLRHRDLHLFASIPMSNAFILVGIEKSHKWRDNERLLAKKKLSFRKLFFVRTKWMKRNRRGADAINGYNNIFPLQCSSQNDEF